MTTEPKTELKAEALAPCRFCNEPKLLAIGQGIGTGLYHAICFGCGAHGPNAETRDQATKEWNTRAPSLKCMACQNCKPDAIKVTTNNVALCLPCFMKLHEGEANPEKRFALIRRRAQTLKACGYAKKGGAEPTEAALDIRFLIQLATAMDAEAKTSRAPSLPSKPSELEKDAKGVSL